MKLASILAVAALAAMPVVAQATIIINTDGPGSNDPVLNGTVPMSDGDVFQMEIFGDEADGGGSAAFGFTGTQGLVAVETSSLNPLTGFANAMVEWNSQADGSGTTFAVLGFPDLVTGSLVTTFAAGETKWLIASWDDVAADLSNFDLRVEATVPLPASVLMLLGGLGGLAYLGHSGRRRAVAAA